MTTHKRYDPPTTEELNQRLSGFIKKRKEQLLAQIPLKPGHIPGTIPEDQKHLAIGFDGDALLTLGQAMEKYGATISSVLVVDTYSASQKSTLAITRIEARDDFPNLGVLGHGTITRTIALEEIRKESQIGMTLVELEMQVMKRMISMAQEFFEKNTSA